MLPSLLSSTLFPYTTLFRSNLDSIISAVRNASPWWTVIAFALGLLTHVGASMALVGFAPMKLPFGRVLIDRKSTRLNSSHVAISYAVFCLKKKNKYTQRKKQ